MSTGSGSALLLFGSLLSAANGTYWQEDRCARTDLGDGAGLSWCVEWITVTEGGTLELQMVWRGSGLSGKSLHKAPDGRNRRMYLVDDLGHRYDHGETRGAAKEGGWIDFDHPVLRGIFVFPAPRGGATSFTFHDDDQRAAISGIVLSPGARSDPALAGPLLEPLPGADSIRIDYRWNGPEGRGEERRQLRRTETGFRIEAPGEDVNLSPEASLPPSVMESFFRTLASSPLLEREYPSEAPVEGDYPAVTLDVRTGKGEVLFFSRAQGERFLPWRAEANGGSYLVPDDTPLRAIEILEPYFGRDPASRALELLEPHLGEEGSMELWERLDSQLGAEEGLRLAHRMKALLERGVEEQEIRQAIDHHVAEHARALEEDEPSEEGKVAGNLPEPSTILAAAAGNDLGAMRSLVSTDADLDVRGRDGKTALMLAAENGHLEMLQLLLEAGAKPDLQRLQGGSALTLAVQNRRTEAVRLLVASGADVNAKDSQGRNALMHAADPGIARILLRAGADVNAADERGLTPSMRVIAEGVGSTASQRTEMLSTLLVGGADLRARDRDGRTALIWATKGTPSSPSFPELVSLLVGEGSELDARDREGGTALAYAVLRGDVESARLLLVAGASTDVQLGNLSLMDVALRYGHSEIVTLLLREGRGR